MYERILVAVDGSNSSNLAIAQAILIAKECGAEVNALFVADDTELFFGVSYPDPNDLMREVMTFGQKVLADAARRFEAEGVRCACRLLKRQVSPSRISDTIVGEACSWSADLIVMGTHGRRGLRRLVMGSVAEGVVRKTHLPVLLIRSELKD